MDTPTCKICGNPHRPSESHVWEGRGFRVVPRPDKKPKRASKPRAGVATHAVIEKKDTAPREEIKENIVYAKGYPPVKKWRGKNQEKYRDYMRAYMTKRRKRKEPPK